MRTILILLATFYSIGAFAQNELTYETVDSITYQQYLKKDYKNLKETGNKALKKEIDFYYLRTRLGIAYYETKNYEKSLIHLKKAYAMNPSEAILKEYYYFSLLYTLRTSDAYDLASGFSKELQSKIGFKKQNINFESSFDRVGITAIAITNNNNSKEKNDILGDGTYAETTLQNNSYIGNLYIENSISNRLKIYNSLSYLTIKSTGIVQTPISDSEIRHYNNTNLNYTLGATYTIKELFQINLFGSFHKEQSNYLTAELDTVNSSIRYFDNPYKFNSFSTGVTLSKRIRNLGISASLSTSNFSDKRQYQYGASLLWYPFGNTNFYSKSSFIYLLNNDEKQYIYSQYVGFKLRKNIRFELNGSYGNHQNLISTNGLISYNTLDPIWFSGEAKLYLRHKKITFIPAFGFQEREGSYYVFSDEDTYETINDKYNNNLYKLTVLWNF